MSRKTRAGEDNPCSKLTTEQVEAIRQRRADVPKGKWGPRGSRYWEIAAEYGLHPRTVIAICRGELWAWNYTGGADDGPEE